MDESVRSHDHNVIVIIVKLVPTLLFQSYPPESSSDGLSDQEDNDSDEEEPLSFTESSSDGDTEGEEEPLSAPLTPPRPHPSQCDDVHRESKLISCCAIG